MLEKEIVFEVVVMLGRCNGVMVSGRVAAWFDIVLSVRQFDAKP